MNTVMTTLVWLTILGALSLSLLTAAAGLSLLAGEVVPENRTGCNVYSTD